VKERIDGEWRLQERTAAKMYFNHHPPTHNFWGFKNLQSISLFFSPKHGFIALNCDIMHLHLVKKIGFCIMDLLNQKH